ncbi:MAG: molybdate ABC transporter substrate-binding protein [Acidobacteria bacterium]|nr:molybdate ABC transporter substrate-binding protein [Acidobacteriota bacterium]
MLSSCLLTFFLSSSVALAAELLVAAASDVAPLEKPLSEGFQRATGQRLRFVFGSSGMLARQIENGAPYDVYLSANEQFVRDLVTQSKILSGSVTIYAAGRVALWSKSGAVRTLSDLRAARRIAMANPAHAPYGVAARQVLEKQGLWPELQSRIVYAENVRQALQFAESGNADAVLTAWSLVIGRGGVLLPAEWHAPVRQSGGIVASSGQQPLAARLLDFLVSKSGRAILDRFGLFAP